MQRYRNNKKGTVYIYLKKVTNCTNNVDGQQMVLYKSEELDSLLFVREEKEFHEKFTLIE